MRVAATATAATVVATGTASSSFFLPFSFGDIGTPTTYVNRPFFSPFFFLFFSHIYCCALLWLLLAESIFYPRFLFHLTWSQAEQSKAQAGDDIIFFFLFLPHGRFLPFDYCNCSRLQRLSCPVLSRPVHSTLAPMSGFRLLPSIGFHFVLHTTTLCFSSLCLVCRICIDYVCLVT